MMNGPFAGRSDPSVAAAIRGSPWITRLVDGGT
jgi:hypothetical protein